MEAKPDIVFHLAAQPLVRTSYEIPVETYEINLMGTVNLFEAVRLAVQGGVPVKAVINVTSEKCYEDKAWVWGYREQDALGGYDPYSNSKACSELATMCYRNSFFHPDQYALHGVALATARSGNVIGGGDWGANRLIPDFTRALLEGKKLKIRNPGATRPWLHVLAVLEGYLLLAEKLYQDGARYGQSYNFGPGDDGAKSVEWIVRSMCQKWGGDAGYEIEQAAAGQHEAYYMKMDCSKAKSELGWQPKWSLDQALDRIIEFTRAHQQNQDLQRLCLTQIEQYDGASV